ncbi:hypothetical protein [Geoalkalibacter sp.]|uniref:hypothetical protein n=1 Tax=Geoalkalibacter sp. TaxID=3041440 RepID=UPI00272E35D4|nr:hypothetical protein [Geoalkalibacter sp.]
MNLERAAMKGKLADLKDKRRAAELRAEGLCRSIRSELNTLIRPVAECEVPTAAQQMDDLVAAWGELASLDGQIARLTRELD